MKTKTEKIAELKKQLRAAKLAHKRSRDRHAQIESIENQLFRLGVEDTLSESEKTLRHVGPLCAWLS